MDPIQGLIAELFRLSPALEDVALSRDHFDLWRVSVTLPRGADSRTRIIHTPGYAHVEEAFAHARQFVMPRGDAAL